MIKSTEKNYGNNQTNVIQICMSLRGPMARGNPQYPLERGFSRLRQAQNDSFLAL